MQRNDMIIVNCVRADEIVPGRIYYAFKLVFRKNWAPDYFIPIAPVKAIKRTFDISFLRCTASGEPNDSYRYSFTDCSIGNNLRECWWLANSEEEAKDLWDTVISAAKDRLTEEYLNTLSRLDSKRGWKRR